MCMLQDSFLQSQHMMCLLQKQTKPQVGNQHKWGISTSGESAQVGNQHKVKAESQKCFDFMQLSVQ